MNILSIESSCDETAAAIVSGDPKKGTPELLSSVVVSQIDIFKEYGGVIPEIAARSHLEAILPVIHKAMQDAGFRQNDWDKIDAIAVTHTPGLLGSLLIGTLTARTLAILHDKPLYAVHHLKSHIYANWLEAEKSIPEFPLLALVVSGGHTQIIYMKAHNQFEIIGTTRDDAVGECFDKVAKILGLPYPGGPSISQAAKNGDPKKYHFPHPKLTAPARAGNNSSKHTDLDFSFSGLRTAVLRKIQEELNLPLNHPSYDLKNHLTKQQVADFAASFEQTAVDILLENLQTATEKYPDVKSIVIAGGVSANARLRQAAMLVNFAGSLRQRAARIGLTPATAGWQPGARKITSERPVFFPPLEFAGDNAAMVGAAAFYEIASGVQPTNPYQLNILPRKDIS